MGDHKGSPGNSLWSPSASRSLIPPELSFANKINLVNAPKLLNLGVFHRSSLRLASFQPLITRPKVAFGVSWLPNLEESINNLVQPLFAVNLELQRLRNVGR